MLASFPVPAFSLTAWTYTSDLESFSWGSRVLLSLVARSVEMVSRLCGWCPCATYDGAIRSFGTDECTRYL